MTSDWIHQSVVASFGQHYAFGPLAISSGISRCPKYSIQYMAGQIHTFPANSGDHYHEDVEEDLINSLHGSLHI